MYHRVGARTARDQALDLGIEGGMRGLTDLRQRDIRPPRSGRVLGRIPSRIGELVVGRAPEPGGIVLDGAFRDVSRRHCVLIRDRDGRVLIRDVSKNGTVLIRDMSKNGTMVNRRPLRFDEPMALQPGDRIVIEGWPEMLSVGRSFEIRAARRGKDTLDDYEVWAAAHYLSGYERRGAWAYWPKGRWGKRIPWKIHIYADSPQQWALVGHIGLIDYLRDQNIAHKTVNGLERLYDLWLEEGGRQKGKAFTVYFPDEDRMITVAKALHKLIHGRPREWRDARIYGDRRLGSTGLLFYRFDQDGRGNYRPNDGIYKPKGVPNPFLKLAREL